MMKITEYVPLSKLGVVRYHESAEEFAGALVRVGAIDPEHSLTVGQIHNITAIAPRGIYNRLERAGFVEVNNPNGAKTFYYLFNEGFGELAREQGHTYYPEHLGPLVLSFPNMPKRIEVNFADRARGAVDVKGTVTTDAEDLMPLLVRAVHIDDSQMLNRRNEIHDDVINIINSVFADPITNSLSLDNALVVLSGIKRWAQNVETYDEEKRAYIKNQFAAR